MDLAAFIRDGRRSCLVCVFVSPRVAAGVTTATTTASYSYRNKQTAHGAGGREHGDTQVTYASSCAGQNCHQISLLLPKPNQPAPTP